MSVDEKAVKEKQSKQEDLMLEKKEIFEKMKENNEKLVNEYILLIWLKIDIFQH